jgi:hypothetical protein
MCMGYVGCGARESCSMSAWLCCSGRSEGAQVGTGSPPWHLLSNRWPIRSNRIRAQAAVSATARKKIGPHHNQAQFSLTCRHAHGCPYDHHDIYLYSRAIDNVCSCRLSAPSPACRGTHGQYTAVLQASCCSMLIIMMWLHVVTCGCAKIRCVMRQPCHVRTVSSR